MSGLIADRLRRRARSHGADPLLTYYDLRSDERTELSATSFLNWVDKTSNLLVDSYLVGAGDTVRLALAESSPGHRVTLAIELAAWQVGATVEVGRDGGPTDLLVLGPDWAAHETGRAAAVLACALHPLGLGFDAALPPGVDDFSIEVRGQPDIHAAVPQSGLALAWVDDERRLTQAELVKLDPPPSAGRRLVRISDPWSSVRDGLVAPLLADGSAVLVVGDDPDRLDRIARTERVDGATP